VAVEPHQQIAGQPALKERIRQRDEVGEEAERHAQVELRAELQQQVAAHQRREQVEAEQRGQAHTQDREQLVIPARDHAIHESRGQHGEGERKHLQHQRQQRAAQPHVRPAEHLLQVLPDRPPQRRLGLKLGAGLQHEGDAREGSPDLVAVHEAAARRGIEDDHAVVAQALEHDEVVELPVQDRGGRQVLQIVVFEAHAPALHAEVTCGLEQCTRARAVATDTGHVS
jgi:hypothetical protein